MVTRDKKGRLEAQVRLAHKEIQVQLVVLVIKGKKVKRVALVTREALVQLV